MRAENTDRLSGLDEESLVALEPLEGLEDAVERGPRARGATGATVHDEVFGALRDVGIEVVLDHAERRFLGPAAALQRGAARCADDASGEAHRSIVAPP